MSAYPSEVVEAAARALYDAYRLAGFVKGTFPWDEAPDDVKRATYAEARHALDRGYVPDGWIRGTSAVTGGHTWTKDTPPDPVEVAKRATDEAREHCMAPSASGVRETEGRLFDYLDALRAEVRAGRGGAAGAAGGKEARD